MNRAGIIVDITRVLTERNISVLSMNCRLNKQDKASISMGFEVHGKDELRYIIEKIRNVEGVIDIERGSNG
jgi:GTP pyrophosphokinase